MLFVLIGLGLIAAKFLGLGPMAAWEFDKPLDLLKFCIPFIAAAVWWAWSDLSGWTKRRAMARDDKRKSDRRERNIEAMGLGHLRRGREGDRAAGKRGR